MSVCQVDGCQEHYGCRLRSKGLQVSPAATPNRYRRPYRPAKADPWAKAKATDDRGVPVIRPNGMPVSVKEFSEERHHIARNWQRADATATSRKD